MNDTSTANEERLRFLLQDILDIDSGSCFSELFDLMGSSFQRKAWKYSKSAPKDAACYQWVADRMFNLSDEYDAAYQSGMASKTKVASLRQWNQDMGYEYTPDTIDNYLSEE